MGLDLRETSKTTSADRCQKTSTVILTGVVGNKRLLKVDCNDRWACEHCKEKFARIARSKVEAALQELRALGGCVFGWLVTFTLDRSEARHGRDAVRRLSKEVNRFNAALRKELPFKECIKLKVRAYEQHADGAWHCHMVIVSRCLLPVKATAFKTYRAGLFKVDFITGEDGIHKAIRYSVKYGLKTVSKYTSRRDRVKGVRVYAISGVAWKHVRRLDYRTKSRRKGLKIWTKSQFYSWVNSLKTWSFVGLTGRSVVLSERPSGWRDGAIYVE